MKRDDTIIRNKESDKDEVRMGARARARARTGARRRA